MDEAYGTYVDDECLTVMAMMMILIMIRMMILMMILMTMLTMVGAGTEDRFWEGPNAYLR